MSGTKLHTDTELETNYSFVYYNFYIFIQQTREKKVVDWMVESITQV
jgi:hypothetical protein